MLLLGGDGGAHLQLIEQALGGLGDGFDGAIERLAVAGGGGAESGDFAHILQCRRSDVVFADLGGHRSAECLDASTHVTSVNDTAENRAPA